MKLPRYSVGICFYNKQNEKKDFDKKCWRILSDCLHMEQVQNATLYGVVAKQEMELLETDYICIFTNIKRSQAVSIARTVLHNPQLCSKLSFYYPVIQHNRLIRMDATDELGCVDENGECGEIVFLPGKAPEYEENYCLVAAFEEDMDPEERIRFEMERTEFSEFWKPFPIHKNLVDSALIHNAGGRVFHFDTPKKKGCVAYVLPDETCLLNEDEASSKSQKEALAKLGYTKVLCTDDFNAEKFLEIGRFSVLARRAEKVIILRPKEENGFFFKIWEISKAACKNVECR